VKSSLLSRLLASADGVESKDIDDQDELRNLMILSNEKWSQKDRPDRRSARARSAGFYWMVSGHLGCIKFEDAQNCSSSWIPTIGKKCVSKARVCPCKHVALPVEIGW
jgi:hypothetical protein